MRFPILVARDKVKNVLWIAFIITKKNSNMRFYKGLPNAVTEVQINGCYVLLTILIRFVLNFSKVVKN